MGGQGSTTIRSARRIRIGGASGYWGDSAHATPQLLHNDPPDFIVYDYLAEITMSILARMRAKDPSLGYATDFVSAVVAPHIRAVAAAGVRLIANAGGVNPEACGEAVRKAIAAAGLDLTVAVVGGDDLMPQCANLAAEQPRDMESGAPFPTPPSIASMNAYLGAEPIARALDAGADIVITGRVVDSALTLGACIHAFGWAMDDFDRLAAGSLGGHLIECGPQVTGGNHTDWRRVSDTLLSIGYPILDIGDTGDMTLTKPAGTGGLVSRATAAEQMLYEISDPARYLLPDVTCDFTQVAMDDIGDDHVRITGARGGPPPKTLKVCATYFDGWRGVQMVPFYGLDASEKAAHLAKVAAERAEAALRALNLASFDDVDITVVGSGAQLGMPVAAEGASEVTVKMAVKHPDAKGVGVFMKALSGLGLTTPPGLASFNSGAGKPQPVVRLFSFTIARDRVTPTVIYGDRKDIVPFGQFGGTAAVHAPASPDAVGARSGDWVEVPLIQLAWARSGDKGNTANVGLIPRDPAVMPYLWAALDEGRLARIFGHLMDDPSPEAIHRYFLPGLPAMNITLAASLGGGGIASLRLDSQGKGYSQILLAQSVAVPAHFVESMS